MYYGSSDDVLGAYVIFVFLGAVFWGVFCAALAHKKERSVIGFFFLGFFFGVIPFMVLAFMNDPRPVFQEGPGELLSNAAAKEQIKRKTEEQIEREKKIETMEDLLNDPQIKKESQMIRKMYGPKAQESYLDSKKEEFNLSS